MELYQIRSFLEVARAGSVTRAAERLLLTQPAVTQHIQALEREFNGPLFDRTGRGVRLTSAGRVLQRRFQEAVACLDGARNAVEAVEAGITGHLNLACSVTLTSSGVGDCIGRLRQEYPNISLTVRTVRSEVVRSLVLDGQVDLGIAAMPAKAGILRVTPLYEQHFVLVTPPAHPFAGKQITKRQAATLEMVGCDPWVGVESSFGDVRAAAIKTETDTVESIRGLVQVGIGCAFLPTHDVARELADGRLAQVRVRGLEMPHRMISLVQRRDTSSSAGVRAFINIVRRHFAAAK